jgi:hypothetical protein
MTAAGAIVGGAFAGLGLAVDDLVPDAKAPLAVGLGAVALAYAMHELGLLKLPVPGRDWQVPADWVRHGFYRSAVIFGGTVGFGVFTRVPYATFPILLAWLFVSGNVPFALAAGLVYGGLRAVSIYSSASCKLPEDVVDLNQNLMSYAPFQHLLAGLGLAAFAAYMLIAPLIS